MGDGRARRRFPCGGRRERAGSRDWLGAACGPFQQHPWRGDFRAGEPDVSTLSARALAGRGGPLSGLCRINQSTLAPVQHCFVDQMPRPHSGKTPYSGQLFRRSGHVWEKCGGSFDVVSLSRVSVFVSVAVSMTDLFGHLGRSYAGPETTGRPRSACGPADQVDIVPGSEGPERNQSQCNEGISEESSSPASRC